MDHLFLYDTHYQINRLFPFIALTLECASPTQHATDTGIVRKLQKKASERTIPFERGVEEWNLKGTVLPYWVDTCHSTGLLSRQNSYDYWLMNFHWASIFVLKEDRFWGQLNPDTTQLAKLLLLRWAWIFDAPMLVALVSKMVSLGTCDQSALVAAESSHIEDILIDVFSAIRQIHSDIRVRTDCRRKIDELGAGFKYNTRRHKVATHWAILRETGVLQADGDRHFVQPRIVDVIRTRPQPRELILEALRPGPFGRGSDLFFEFARGLFNLKSRSIADLDSTGWQRFLPAIRQSWLQILKWDRKFLGIRPLAELYAMKSLLDESTVASPASWQSFLADRARHHPEELTVHVDRFGGIEYLRLGVDPPLSTDQ